MGMIGILNVGTGDTKLVFDKSNPAEVIRSGRIVKDMLRRGYALLIEVDDGKGGKAFQRVKEFREDTAEYIIADFAPIEADRPTTPQGDEKDGEEQEVEAASHDAASAAPGGKEPAKRGRPKKIVDKSVPASGTRGIAISRSAGG